MNLTIPHIYTQGWYTDFFTPATIKEQEAAATAAAAAAAAVPITGLEPPSASTPPHQHGAEDERCITLRLLVLRVESTPPATTTEEQAAPTGTSAERHYAKYYRTAVQVAGCVSLGGGGGSYELCVCVAWYDPIG